MADVSMNPGNYLNISPYNAEGISKQNPRGRVHTLAHELLHQFGLLDRYTPPGQPDPGYENDIQGGGGSKTNPIRNVNQFRGIVERAKTKNAGESFRINGDQGNAVTNYGVAKVKEKQAEGSLPRN